MWYKVFEEGNERDCEIQNIDVIYTWVNHKGSLSIENCTVPPPEQRPMTFDDDNVHSLTACFL